VTASIVISSCAVAPCTRIKPPPAVHDDVVVAAMVFAVPELDEMRILCDADVTPASEFKYTPSDVTAPRLRL
jgi:hypothetical protein